MNKCISVLRAALVAIVFLAFTPFAYGQAKVNYVGNWYQEALGERTPTNVGLFAPINEGRDSKIYHLQLDNNELSSLLVNAPAVLNLTVPYGGSTITLNLARVNVTAQNMNVITDKGEVEYTPGLHYRGIVNNNHLFMYVNGELVKTDEGAHNQYETVPTQQVGVYMGTDSDGSSTPLAGHVYQALICALAENNTTVTLLDDTLENAHPLNFTKQLTAIHKRVLPAYGRLDGIQRI